MFFEESRVGSEEHLWIVKNDILLLKFYNIFGSLLITSDLKLLHFYFGILLCIPLG